MPINWSLFQPVDVGAKWREGWDRGQKRGEAIRLKSALAAFGANPSDPRAQGELAAISPEFAMEMGKAKWKSQAEIDKARLAAAWFNDDPATGVPAGINGKPRINWRERQAAAARGGADQDVVTQLGALADDQEAADRHAAEELVKDQTAERTVNPITGVITYHNRRGTPIGSARDAFLRDSRGIPYQAGTAPPTIEQAPPDSLSGAPTDPSISYTNPADTPEQATVRAKALKAIFDGASPADVWARAATAGVYP